MTGIGAETKPGTMSWGLPMTDDVSELVDETFGGSKTGPDVATGALTEAEAGTCTRTEVGALTRIEAGA